MLLLIISFNFLFKYFIRLFLSPFILRTISNNGKMLVCILKCYISIDRTSHSNARSFESSFLKQKNILFKLSTMLYIFLEKLYGLMGGREELLGLVKNFKTNWLSVPFKKKFQELLTSEKTYRAGTLNKIFRFWSILLIVDLIFNFQFTLNPF